MVRTPIAFALLLAAAPAMAQPGLGAWDQVSGDLFLAATRAGVEPPTAAMHCIGDYPDSSRWDAGHGVDVLANNDGAGHLTQIEAGWNNDRPASDRASAGTFRALCATFAALAQPNWSKAEIARAVTKTMIVPPSRQDSVDREQALTGLKLYGSRNTPDPKLRDRPDEAFLQCGAVAD